MSGVSSWGHLSGEQDSRYLRNSKLRGNYGSLGKSMIR